MAAYSVQSLHHPALLRHISTDAPPPSAPSSLFLRPAAAASAAAAPSSLSSSATTIAAAASSYSTATPSTSQPPPASLDALERHLAAQDFQRADEETRRLLLELAGEAAQKRGYVFFSEVQFIPDGELRAVDELWRCHSGGRFGYSVQRKVWEKAAKEDFTRFFIKVGWMKRLEGAGEDQVAQYNYRAFPGEFMWELKEDTPEGHLPLTNCLRGTQLLSSILNHPALAAAATDDDEDEQVEERQNSSPIGNTTRSLMNKGFLKPADYSF